MSVKEIYDALEWQSGGDISGFDDVSRERIAISQAISLKRIADTMERHGQYWNDEAEFRRLLHRGVLTPRPNQPFAAPQMYAGEGVPIYIMRCVAAMQAWMNGHIPPAPMSDAETEAPFEQGEQA